MIENFGKNLTKLRKEKNISQVELANELGIGKQSISDYEKQKTYPTFTNLEKIAVFFDATPTQIFGTSQEQELEISRKNIDEYEKKATTILEAANVIPEIERMLFETYPKVQRLDDGTDLYTHKNLSTGKETVSTDFYPDGSVNDSIVKELSLYEKIKQTADNIEYIINHQLNDH